MAETLLYYKKNDGYGFHEENIIPAVITVTDRLSPSNKPSQRLLTAGRPWIRG